MIIYFLILFNEIFRSDLSKSNHIAIEPIGGTAITAVDFDYESKSIFYADAGGLNKGIVRVTVGDGESKVIVKNAFGAFTIHSLAIDWVNCKIYLNLNFLFVYILNRKFYAFLLIFFKF